ncbi:MAG: Gfo/Idh/MocA family oxidoreductase [Planctomycetaceae bacterium]
MLNRRQFLQSSALASVTFAAPAIVRGENLNSRLQMAAIGCDGKGWSDLKEMHDHPQVKHVGFCDIDLARTTRVKELAPDVPIFQDYREMFTKLDGKIDAVTVSTPDHMHAFISLDAMRRGMHVYCQKPLTHNVWESRQMTRQAAKSKVITRLGNQIHSHSFYLSTVQAIQEGVIGKVKRVHSWCAATGHGKSFHISRPTNPVAPPATLDWEKWIGVAPMRPYGGDKVYHPWGWRDWQDFGNGALGDFGCHILDPVFSALKIVGAPKTILADHTGINDEVWPAQTTVDYMFPGTEYTSADTLAITWNDGGRLPSVSGSHLATTVALPRSGSLFIGETGSLVLPHVGAPTVYRTTDHAGEPIPLLPSLNHYHGWVDGCISQTQPSDGFAYGGPLTEAVLLGNIAVRYRNETLHWDAENLSITNNTTANKWLTRPYRDGWNIEPVT